MRNLLEKDIKPLDIMTKAAFRNAIVVTNISESSFHLTVCGSQLGD